MSRTGDWYMEMQQEENEALDQAYWEYLERNNSKGGESMANGKTSKKGVRVTSKTPTVGRPKKTVAKVVTKKTTNKSGKGGRPTTGPRSVRSSKPQSKAVSR